MCWKTGNPVYMKFQFKQLKQRLNAIFNLKKNYDNLLKIKKNKNLNFYKIALIFHLFFCFLFFLPFLVDVVSSERIASLTGVSLSGFRFNGIWDSLVAVAASSTSIRSNGSTLKPGMFGLTKAKTSFSCCTFDVSKLRRMVT